MNFRAIGTVTRFGTVSAVIIPFFIANIQIDNEISISVNNAFAQNDTTPSRGDLFPSPASAANPSLQSINNTAPVVSRLSHEGIYEVQVLWSVPQTIQSPNILPQKGFDMHIEFLDPKAPDQAERIIGEHNLISDELRPVPIIKPLLPVENYDIEIISVSGDVLWNQEDKSPSAGRTIERVILDQPYEGNITISITDIQSPLTSLVDSVQLPVRLT
jgi:hypothetical protein